jgi:hypothetical protein
MRKTRPQDGQNEPAGGSSWFATFTFLDAGGAISASQWRSARAFLVKWCRWTLGRLVSPKLFAGA